MAVQTKSLQVRRIYPTLKIKREKLQLQWQLLQGTFPLPSPEEGGGIWAGAEEGCSGLSNSWVRRLGSPCRGVTSCARVPLVVLGLVQPHHMPGTLASAQWHTQGTGGRDKAMWPSRQRRRSGHPVPQRGGTGMPRLQPGPRCCGLKQQRPALPCLRVL